MATEKQPLLVVSTVMMKQLPYCIIYVCAAHLSAPRACKLLSNIPIIQSLSFVSFNFRLQWPLKYLHDQCLQKMVHGTRNLIVDLTMAPGI